VELETHVQETISQDTKTSTSEVEEQQIIATYRPKRTIRPPARCCFEDMASFALVINNRDPTTFQEAVNS